MRRLVVLAIVFGAAVGAILALVAALHSVPARTVTAVHDASLAVTDSVVIVTMTVDAAVPVDAPIDAPHPRPRPVRVAVDAGVVQVVVDAASVPAFVDAGVVPTTADAAVPPAPEPAPPTSPAERAKLAKDLLHRGGVAQVNGRIDEALKLYTQSYQLVPSNWTKLQMAYIHFASNTVEHWKEAVRLSKQVLANSPEKFDMQRANQIISWASNELLARGIDPP